MYLHIRVISLLLLSILYLSCGGDHQPEIHTLYTKIDEINLQITLCQHDSTAEGRIRDSFKTEIDHQTDLCDALNDSTQSCTNENLMASAYIFVFDKNPIDIFWEYVNTNDSEKKTLVVIGLIALRAYEENNKIFVDSIRNNFRHLDQQKRQCIRKISDAQHKVQQAEQAIKRTGEKIGELDSQKEEYNRQLKKLNT